MKAQLLLIFFLLSLSAAKANSFKRVVNPDLKEDTQASVPLSSNGDDEKGKKSKKRHKHYQCKGHSKHKHARAKCREHDEDDDHCHHSNCEHRRKKGAVVIEFPTAVIPFPSRH